MRTKYLDAYYSPIICSSSLAAEAVGMLALIIIKP